LDLVAGLIMAAAVEHVDLHRRIALNAMRLVGTSPRMLILGFMLPTAFLSMWISNTATTAMMIPIMEAVLQELDSTMMEPEAKDAKKNLRAMLAMSVCMSANIGGTGTTIGTGPNLVLMEIIGRTFPDNPLSFASWMAFAVPLMVLNLVVLWMWLQFYYLPRPCSSKKSNVEGGGQGGTEKIAQLVERKCKELGPMKFKESVVLTLFVILVLLWLFRSPGFIEGYGDLIGTGIDDATPAIAIVIILFLMPTDASPFLRLEPSSSSLLDWHTVEKRLPWGIIILLGGGFALAEGSNRSGLNDWIGTQLASLSDLPGVLILLVVCVLTSILTQVASNSASASIINPIMAQLSVQLKINPLYMMLPPTLVCSFAYMLPVSTPPNAIAFGPSGMRTVDMMKVGFVMNLVSISLTFLAIYSYGMVMFSLNEFPDWATVNVTTRGDPAVQFMV
jgi:sodium-dependent dicarboxylate transporter 2/3/5